MAVLKSLFWTLNCSRGDLVTHLVLDLESRTYALSQRRLTETTMSTRAVNPANPRFSFAALEVESGDADGDSPNESEGELIGAPLTPPHATAQCVL